LFLWLGAVSADPGVAFMLPFIQRMIIRKSASQEFCPSPAAKDFTRGTRGLLIWGVPVAGLLLGSYLPERYLVVLWPSALTFMGVACLVNARGCGRLHCYFTGPFFLVMAAVALLYGLGVIPLGPHGWNILGVVLLVGGVGLCCGSELLLGQYRQARR